MQSVLRCPKRSECCRRPVEQKPAVFLGAAVPTGSFSLRNAALANSPIDAETFFVYSRSSKSNGIAMALLPHPKVNSAFTSDLMISSTTVARVIGISFCAFE